METRALLSGFAGRCFAPTKTKLAVSAEFAQEKDDSQDDKDLYLSMSKQQSLLSSSATSLSFPSPGGVVDGTLGLSRFHQSILSRTSSIRQCFVTGRYPLTVSFRECPTRKWLRWESSNQVMVNGTSIAKSLASLDRFQWLDRSERRALVEDYDMIRLELAAEIHMDRPGYLQILSADTAGSTAALVRQRRAEGRSSLFQSPSHDTAAADAAALSFSNAASNPQLTRRRFFDIADCPVLDNDRLWVTGFSLAARSGHICSMEADSGEMESINARTKDLLLWPNEVALVPNPIWKHPRPDVVDHGNSVPAVTTPPKQASPSPPFIIQPHSAHEDALLVADGFLVPGKDRGGLYIVQHPGNPDAEWTVRLTSSEDRWFYHRATWMDLTGDGRLSLLTARCQVSTRFPSATASVNDDDSTDPKKKKRNTQILDGIASGISKEGQLVWLECPQPHRIDPATGTPLEADGTVFDPFSSIHLPWKERVLATGPDVMFAVADLDPTDDTIEVLCSEFFAKRVSLKSIHIPRHANKDKKKAGRKSLPKVVFERTIDERCGAAFGCIWADLDVEDTPQGQASPMVLDSGSTVPCLKRGDDCSHLLVTSHECTYAETTDRTAWNQISETGEEELNGSGGHAQNEKENTVDAISSAPSNGEGASSVSSAEDGGSLFAYRIPKDTPSAWKTQPWIRSTVATGFKVQGQLGNMINPGAPGFVYTFHAKEEVEAKGRRTHRPRKRPLIAVAGDCAESAYIFRPEKHQQEDSWNDIASGRTQKDRGSSTQQQPQQKHMADRDMSTNYKLMAEIQCQATVGSIGIGYDDFLSLPTQESGYAKLYIPCFEKDKILVFALGSGEDVDDEDNDW